MSQKNGLAAEEFAVCKDCEELKKQLKLVQNHCVKQWNQGYQLRGMHDKYQLLEAQREVARLKEQLANDNAYFTEEIMRLEEKLNEH